MPDHDSRADSPASLTSAFVIAPSAPAQETEEQSDAAGQNRATEKQPARADGFSLGDRARIVLWFGLATGFGEAVVRLADGLARGHFLLINEHFLWLTPFAETAVFALLGMPLLAILAWLPRRSSLFILVATLAFVGGSAVLSRVPGLHLWAVLLLAAGIAWRAAQATERRTEPFLRMVRRSTPWMAATVLLLAGAIYGRRALEERAARQALPPAPKAAPNVLLVVLDTVRADSLSLYSESGAETPHLDELARHSTVFDQAVAPSSWTLPSHASMFTGRYANELSADWWSPLDDRHPTLAERMSQQGYATAGFVANLAYCSRATGLDRGFTHYEDYELSVGEVLRHSRFVELLALAEDGPATFGLYETIGRKSGAELSGDFLRWVDNHRERPFFAFLNYFDAHDPYLPSRLADSGRALTHQEKTLMSSWDTAHPEELSEEQVDLARECYLSMVHQLDAEMGRLLAELERRGLRDETVIIITSDHGESFGEHGAYYHGNNLYPSNVHVPLIVCWPPAVPTDARVETPVSLTDIAATVLDLAGIDQESPLPGRSLRKAMTGSPDERASSPFATVSPHPIPEVFPFHRLGPAAGGTMYSLLSDRNYLIREGDGSESLLDFRKPAEQQTLPFADTPEDTLHELRKELDRLTGEK